MMFIIRTSEAPPSVADVEVKVSRKTPAIVPGGQDKTDHFCVAEPAVIDRLHDGGVPVVAVHDGYYEDGRGGGIGVWGQGKYWEIRDTPFTVKEAVGPTQHAEGTAEGEHVEVRRAIFGA
jgi:hypothetical protein